MKTWRPYHFMLGVGKGGLGREMSERASGVDLPCTIRQLGVYLGNALAGKSE